MILSSALMVRPNLPRPPASPQAASRPPNPGGKSFLLFIPSSLSFTSLLPAPPPKLGEAGRGRLQWRNSSHTRDCLHQLLPFPNRKKTTPPDLPTVVISIISGVLRAIPPIISDPPPRSSQSRSPRWRFRRAAATWKAGAEQALRSM